MTIRLVGISVACAILVLVCFEIARAEATSTPRQLIGQTFKSNGRPAVGPDGFPYLIAYRAADAKVAGGQAYSMIVLAKAALTNHCGIAVYERATSEKKAVWVFSLGEVVLLARNAWQLPDPRPAPTMPPGGKVDVGTPSLDALPTEERRAIAAFLRNDHVTTPKIAMLVMKDASGKAITPYMLMANLPASLYPNNDAWQVELRRIQWLLPPSYDVMQPPADTTVFGQVFQRVDAIDARLTAPKN